MLENRIAKWAIGVSCALLLGLIIVVALILDSRSEDPILGVFRKEETEETTEATEGTQPEEQENTEPAQEQVQPPQDQNSTVEIPVVQDPQDGGAGIQLPYEIPEYGLTVQRLAPYNGMFVEDGTNANVENVAMLMVENNGDFPVEYTQICVNYQGQQLYFDISALPVGEKLVVQEKNGKSIPEGAVASATAMIVQRADMDMSADQVQVTDNGDNTLTIQNLTEETIPTVRVFYKYYMEESGIFVGGIAFTVRITRLSAGASVTVQPSHYTSQNCRVVMVLTYDSEV